MPRTVITLGTIPSRAPEVIPVLRSLLDQEPDRIYLWIPRWFRRKAQEGSIPEALASFCRDHPKVHAELVDDLGPITKLLPVLRYETEPGTRIVVTDDDGVVCNPLWLRELVSHACPEAAMGYAGFTFLRTTRPWRVLIAHRHLQSVGILEACSGYILERGWLRPELVGMIDVLVSRWDENLELLCGDDLIVSCYLHHIGIDTRVVVSREVHCYNVIRRTHQAGTDALSLMHGQRGSNLRNYERSHPGLLRLLAESVKSGTSLRRQTPSDLSSGASGMSASGSGRP